MSHLSTTFLFLFSVSTFATGCSDRAKNLVRSLASPDPAASGSVAPVAAPPAAEPTLAPVASASATPPAKRLTTGSTVASAQAKAIAPAKTEPAKAETPKVEPTKTEAPSTPLTPFQKKRLLGHYSTFDGASGFTFDRTAAPFKAKLDGSSVATLSESFGPRNTKEYRGPGIWIRVDENGSVLLFQGPKQTEGVRVLRDADAEPLR